MLDLHFLSLVSFIHLVNFLFSLLPSNEHINVSNRFCFLGGIFYLLTFDSLFPILLCCFFFSCFISHSAFWKHRVSFWPIFPLFWDAFIHTILFLCIFPFYVGEPFSLYPWIQNGLAKPITRVGALPGSLSYLLPNVQCLADTYSHHWFSSWLPKKGFRQWAAALGQSQWGKLFLCLEEEFPLPVFLWGLCTPAVWCVCS